LPRWLLKYFCMFWIAFQTVIGFPWVCFLMLIHWSGDASMDYVQRVWGKAMLWAPGAKLRVEGNEYCDPKRPTIYVSNHQSTLDIPTLFQALLPVHFRFVAKKIVKYVPIMGWYLVLAGFVFIDRKNRRAALKSLDLAAQKIRNGTSIVMFPEGTRSPDGRILPFKKGPFALAMKAGVGICPVAIEGTGTVMPKNSWNVQPGEVRVKIGPPIDPAQFGNDREALARHVRDRIIDLHLQIGGLGGDRNDAIAAPGLEGVGRAARRRGGGGEEAEA
jgi:1-acyl-sn-glycerol-3-phosphate acyltransferase